MLTWMARLPPCLPLRGCRRPRHAVPGCLGPSGLLQVGVLWAQALSRGQGSAARSHRHRVRACARGGALKSWAIELRFRLAWLLGRARPVVADLERMRRGAEALDREACWAEQHAALTSMANRVAIASAQARVRALQHRHQALRRVLIDEREHQHAAHSEQMLRAQGVRPSVADAIARCGQGRAP